MILLATFSKARSFRRNFLDELSVIDNSRLPPIEFMEKNVRVRVGKHESARQIISSDEAIALTFRVLSFEIVKGLLDVKVRILEKQLSFLFNLHLSVKDFSPKCPV